MNEARDILLELFDGLAKDWEEVAEDLRDAPLPAFDTTKNAVVVLNRILQTSAEKAEGHLNSGLETSDNVDSTLVPTVDESYLRQYATAIGCGYLLHTISAKFKEQNLDQES